MITSIILPALLLALGLIDPSIPPRVPFNNNSTPRFNPNNIRYFNPFYNNKFINTTSNIKYTSKTTYFYNIYIFINYIKDII